jgi:hypothetical protein
MRTLTACAALALSVVAAAVSSVALLSPVPVCQCCAATICTAVSVYRRHASVLSCSITGSSNTYDIGKLICATRLNTV